LNCDRLEALRAINERAGLSPKEAGELIVAVGTLRHAINSLGERYDECVRHALGGDVCGGCRCKYANKGKPPNV
jgi:hypothetical protein